MSYKLCYKKPSANKLHRHIITNDYNLANFEKALLRNKTIRNRKTLRIIKNPKWYIFKIRKTEAKRLLRRCPF